MLVWEGCCLVQSFSEYLLCARCGLYIRQTGCCCRKDCWFCLLEVARDVQEVHLQVELVLVLVLETVSLVSFKVHKVQQLATDCRPDKSR